MIISRRKPIFRTARLSAVAAPAAFVAFLLTAVMGTALALPAAQAATWSDDGTWATRSDGGYVIRNDVWGAGAGPQRIWANSYKNWGVHANHPGGGGVRAYPHVAKAVNRPLNALNRLNSSYAVKVPSGGVHNTAYDIWANGQDYEIMIWVGSTGGAAPISQTNTTHANLGGHGWTIHRGSNGSTKATISFVQDRSSTSGTVDLLAILKYIQSKGWFRNITIGEVQFGWEISASEGGADFEVTDYNVSIT